MAQLLFISVGLVVGTVVLAGVLGIVFYNRLVTLRERFRNAFAQIDVQLKRRHDLIPNLVEATKGYLAHERETLEKVIAARNAAVTAVDQAAADPTDKAAVRQAASAENSLVALLGQFRIIQEDYPDLKGDATVRQLMEELTSTENRIAFARQHYNDATMTYNAYRQSVPQVFVANAAGFGPAELFEVNDPSEREAVAVDLGRG
ncbi:MAG: LemA family protein [Planctomycetota bacterium]